MKSRKKSLSQSFIFLSECRGEHCSSVEKRSFSDFPKENNQSFALRRLILLGQNQRTTNGRPYEYIFDRPASKTFSI